MTKDLRIAVKREYFEQIQRGDKKEEFRARTEYWRKRLVGKRYDTVTITLGYPKKGDPDREIVFKYIGYSESIVKHKIFNDEYTDVYAIRLHKRVGK